MVDGGWVVVGGAVLVLITIADVMVVRKLGRSRKLPGGFFVFYLLTSVVFGVAVGLPFRNH